MKCPYCGKENEGSVCVKCKAALPEPEPQKKPEKHAEKREKKEGRE